MTRLRVIAAGLFLAFSTLAATSPLKASSADDHKVVDRCHTLCYLVVSPDGPADGGDFGPKTPGTKTSGIQEALDRAKEIRRDVYIVGGGFREAFKGGIAYRLDTTLRVPWMQQFRLDGGEYQIHYTPKQGDAVVIDSQMNCRLKFGLVVASASDGAAVRIAPTTKGPDNFSCVVASTFEFNGMVGSGDVWGKSSEQKSTGLVLDASHGGIAANKIFIGEINACRRGVYVTQGCGNNTIEAQWIHLTNLGIQIGDADRPGVSGNRITAGISGDIPKTAGLQVFGHHNTLTVDILSADAGRGLTFEVPAHDNLVIAGNLVGGIANHAQKPTNRVITAAASGSDIPTPPMAAAGADTVNRHPFPVEVRILTPGKVSQWTETNSDGKAHAFDGPLAKGQTFTLSPGDRVRFSYRESPTWYWKGL
jgi:hypothetical protein